MFSSGKCSLLLISTPNLLDNSFIRNFFKKSPSFQVSRFSNCKSNHNSGISRTTGIFEVYYISNRWWWWEWWGGDVGTLFAIVRCIYVESVSSRLEKIPPRAAEFCSAFPRSIVYIFERRHLIVSDECQHENKCC